MSQPNLPLYPFSPNLNSFPVDTASTPGAFDNPALPRQNWHDEGAAALVASGQGSQPISYFYWDQNTGKQVFFTRTARQASAPNLDLSPYPAYVPAPLNGVIASFPGSPQLKPVTLTDPTIFSTAEQASAVANVLGGTVVDITPNTEVLTFPAAETRREFGIVVNGAIYNVGKLMVQQYAQGVGAPGGWSLTATGPTWMPIAAPSTPLVPVPTPQRALLPNEQVTSVSIVGIPYFEVQRTDLNAGPGVSSAPSAIDTDTNTTVHAILSALQKLGLAS